MPNTLPVPSKAALRTLRNLALGTSCSVAFTTGLLTEDRRRRICAAREVHTNAKKLKSSRQYHSAGSPSVESFEEQVMRYRDDGFWQTNDSTGTLEQAQNFLPLEPRASELARPGQRPHFPIKTRRFELENPSRTRWKPSPTSPPDQNLEPLVLPRGTIRDRQQRLASDITKLLQDGRESLKVEAAAVRFFEAFEEGIPVSGLGLRKDLTDAVIRLSKACVLDQKHEARHKILDLVLAHGPIDEHTFFSLGGEQITRALTDGPKDQTTGLTTVEDCKLRKASALYLTKFKEQPGIANDSWRCLGETLCAITCHHQLFDLTETLYWRLEQCRGDAPNGSFLYLLTALHNQERHKKVVKLFRRFFGSIPLDQLNFLKAGEIVIESALKVRRLDLTEEVLVTLAKTSEDHQLYCPSAWFTKVLRSDWENHRDITRTQAFFERLVPKLGPIMAPQAVYGAIIQFSIVGGDEITAQSYYRRLQKEYGSIDARGVRTLGHFAYAKAMRNDWNGVKDDFRNSWKMVPGGPDRVSSSLRMSKAETAARNLFRRDYSASFAPIFTLFAKTHSVNETEEFLQSFIDYLNVTLTPHMSTTMINKYSEAKEIDSISRWLDYMISIRSPVDPMFFNAIISSCHREWKFSFEETHQLYRNVRKLDGTAANFLNNDTLSILRGIAISDASRDVASAVRNLNRLKLDQPMRHTVDSRSVQEDMALALARGNPRKALLIYDRARKYNTIPLHIACVNIAVKASLRDVPNDIHYAASFLQKPQSAGEDISIAVAEIFIHQMSYRYSADKHVRVQDIAKDTIAMLEEHGVAVRPQMITHTMRALVSRRQHYQATEFWDSMSRRQNMPSLLDLPTLTVLLQAYIGVQDCVGVEWTIRMLSLNGLVPDLSFKRSLERALKETRKLPEREGVHTGRRFYEVVEIALQSINAMTLEATNDKADFKIKTFKIMERAIEFQRVLDSGTDRERIRKIELRSQAEGGEKSLSSEASGGPLGASEWVDSDEESDFQSYVPPVSKLVGVNT